MDQNKREYYVGGGNSWEGPYDLEDAVELLFDLCGDNFSPPERINGTVIAEVYKGYGDVAKLNGKTLDGKFAYFNQGKLNEVLEVVRQSKVEGETNE